MAEENYNLEDIKGVDPKIIGVHPTVMTNSVNELAIITYDEVSNIDYYINKEENNSRKGYC